MKTADRKYGGRVMKTSGILLTVNTSGMAFQAGETADGTSYRQFDACDYQPGEDDNGETECAECGKTVFQMDESYWVCMDGGEVICDDCIECAW